MLCFPLKLHAGGSDFRLHVGSDLQLSYRRKGPDYEFGYRAKPVVSGRVHRDSNLLLQYSSVSITVEFSFGCISSMLALVFLLLINVRFITVQLQL